MVPHRLVRLNDVLTLLNPALGLVTCVLAVAGQRYAAKGQPGYGRQAEITRRVTRSMPDVVISRLLEKRQRGKHQRDQQRLPEYNTS